MVDYLLQRWEGIRRKLPAVNFIFLGHPVHAMLTDLPAALIPTGFALRLAGSISGERSVRQAGVICTGLGVASAVPTAVTGLADYLQMEVSDPAQKTGFIHGILNIAAFAAALGSLPGAGRKAPPGRGLALSGLATSILLFSALLGGDLVYLRGWRVKPIEREEMERHQVPESVHPRELILSPS
jgi:uncharacterized membrane protein